METKDSRGAKRRYPRVAVTIEDIFDQARTTLAYQQQLEEGDRLADMVADFEASLTADQRALLYRMDMQAARAGEVLDRVRVVKEEGSNVL